MFKTGRRRAEGTFGVALAVFVLWIAITALTGYVPEGTTDIMEVVSEGVARQFVFAGCFLLLIAFIFRWRDLGFAMPRRGLIGLMWLPAIYVAILFSSAYVLGFPPPLVMLIVFVNTLLVGISEETMFRGVLFSGARRSMGPWPAIALVTFLFGFVHLFNVMFTGNLLVATMQAIAATMSGLLFMAIRIRSGSLIPGIFLHGIWDFALLTVAQAASAQVKGQSLNDVAAQIPWYHQLLPVTLVLPLFLYALFLLRKVGRVVPA